MNSIRPFAKKIQGPAQRRLVAAASSRSTSTIAAQDPSSRFSSVKSLSESPSKAQFHSTTIFEDAAVSSDPVVDPFDPRNYGYRVVPVAVTGSDFLSATTATSTSASSYGDYEEQYPTDTHVSWPTERSAIATNNMIMDSMTDVSGTGQQMMSLQQHQEDPIADVPTSSDGR